MKDGFIKCAAATLQIEVGDCDFNAEKIIGLMKKADAEGVKLLALPELCLSGYSCGDLFLQDTLLDGAEKALERIVDKSKRIDTVAVVGVPLRNFGKLFNCAAVIYKGDILGVVPKSYIPNYGEFYEGRYFVSGDGLTASEIVVAGRTCPFGRMIFRNTYIGEYTFGAEICEDMWTAHSPSVELTSQGANVILNLSAGNEIAGKREYRRTLVAAHSGRLCCGYVYANAGEGESTGDAVFAGHDLIAECGNILCESKLFENSMIISEIDVKKIAYERRKVNTFCAEEARRVVYFDQKPQECTITRNFAPAPFVPQCENERNDRCELILNIQSQGLKKRVLHARSKTMVVGLSGGLDSALALLVMIKAADAMGMERKNIIAVTMPCFGTTKRTKSNAQLLAEGLGVTFKSIDITKSVERHFEDIGQSKEEMDVTYENAQARERTQVLMDIANKESGLVVGTGDLSELALGWATYNGDHMSMYGVNASVPKTLVRYLVKYYADTCGNGQVSDALYDILATPVSPELLPSGGDEIAQQTEYIVGPYELHDFFLYYIVRWGYSPNKVLRIANKTFEGKYDRKTVLKWLQSFYKRFFIQQFKRSCVPDGPKVGSVALSPRGDWRMPSDANSHLWLKELEELDIQ